MENNLKLIVTEKFEGLACNFYNDAETNEICMTRTQIGEALGYVNPNKAIDKIHQRHNERLNRFSTTVNLGVVEGGRNVTREMVVYSTKGVYEICRWSRQPKADAFMDFVWEVVEKFRTGQLQAKTTDIAVLEKGMTMITDMCKTLSETVKEMQKDIIFLKQNQVKAQAQARMQNKGFSPWRSEMFKKLYALEQYLKISRNELLRTLYIRFREVYGVNLTLCKIRYCSENNLVRCYTLDMIENQKQLREPFATMVDDLLKKYGISVDENVFSDMETVLDDMDLTKS